MGLNRQNWQDKKAINVKKILAVINATYAVTKTKPEKIRLAYLQKSKFVFLKNIQMNKFVGSFQN